MSGKKGASSLPRKSAISSGSDAFKIDTIKIDELKLDFLEAAESEVGIRALYEIEAGAYRIKPSRSSEYYVKLTFPTISNNWKYIFPAEEGTNGQVLAADFSTNPSGNKSATFSWISPSSASGAQTAITSVLNNSLKVGGNSQNNTIDFSTDDVIMFDIDNTEKMRVDTNGITIKSGKEIRLEDDTG